jgi:hypothetical protein
MIARWFAALVAAGGLSVLVYAAAPARSDASTVYEVTFDNGFDFEVVVHARHYSRRAADGRADQDPYYAVNTVLRLIPPGQELRVPFPNTGGAVVWSARPATSEFSMCEGEVAFSSFVGGQVRVRLASVQCSPRW